MLKPENPNAFTRYPYDRAGHLRRDAAWLSAAIADDARANLLLFHDLKPLLYESGEALQVRWLDGRAHEQAGPANSPLLFLGVDAAGGAYFACEIQSPDAFEAFGRFADLRGSGARIPADELPVIGAARSVFEWHRVNQFCAKCGARSEPAEAGWKRVCPQCQREHFPRVDPVVIMVPVLGDRVLLGRQKGWPRGMYSALAGFMEPGETIEEAAARETLEEAGLVVTHVRMHSTQPWPFPHSLMIGAVCDVEADTVRVDDHELEGARWFTREEAKLLLAAQHPECFAPPPFAIAHQILKAWVEAG